MIAALIPAIAGLIGKVVDRAVPDKAEAERLKADLTMQLLSLNQEELKASSSIIIAEAQGGSWLQRSWRPITALTFVSLVVAHWLGFTADNLTQETINKIMDIVQLMVGGYVVGRSAEKVVKEWKQQ